MSYRMALHDMLELRAKCHVSAFSMIASSNFALL